MKLIKLKNKAGFTLTEVMISMVILVGSILAISEVYIKRKQDEVQVKYFSGFQSVHQAVMSRYYASPGDFPVATITGNTSRKHFVACMTTDGRILIDFTVQTYQVASEPTDTPVFCNVAANIGSVTIPPNGFEVHMIPSSWDAWFTVRIIPMTQPADRDKNSFLYPPVFQLAYDLNFTNFDACIPGGTCPP